jgi:glycosyltransferase involved in cell wall biosynthesis
VHVVHDGIDAAPFAAVSAGARKAAERFSVGAIREALAAVVAGARPVPRIVLVSHSAEPSGAELSLVDLATFFGRDARVCLFQHGPLAAMLRARGVPVEVLAASPRMLRLRSRTGVLSIVAAIPAVLGLVRALAARVGKDDLLYANSQKAWIVAALVAVWRRRPVVWHLRDILSAARFGTVQRAVAIELANRVAACVVVNSTATGRAFVANGGRPALVRVVHNGIDEAPFAASRAAAAARSQAGRRITVGLFGRLASWKGQHVLLAALERLHDVDALIVGEALFGEHDYRERLLALAAAPALAGRVRFLGHRTDVAELMRGVDIVVHTSIEPEPFGRVIVEGMLAERPVIATRGGGVDEIITDGRDGVLVRPGDPAELAAAIGALARDPERARALASAGCAKARQRFGLPTMQHAVAAVLQDLVPVHARD